MQEGTYTYLIRGPLGITRIEACQCPEPYRGTVIGRSELVFCRFLRNLVSQPFLPFPHTSDIDSYIGRLEKDIESILDIVQCVRVRREQLLRFCLEGGRPATELTASCPALALLAADKLDQIDDYGSYNQIVNTLLQQKRHRILGYFGFPARRWVVELFKKIPARLASPLLFDDLKKILQRDAVWEIKILRHLPCLNKFVIDTLLNPFIVAHAAPPFYLQACQYPVKFGDVDVYSLLSDLNRLQSLLHSSEDRVSLKLSSLSDLAKVHDLLYQHHLDQRHREIIAATFRQPPIPAKRFIDGGNEYGIYPIIDGKSLLAESKAMNHCIASYYEEFRRSEDLYAYHLTLPPHEHATFLISRSGSQWHLEEMRGKANCIASNSANRFVKQWLDDWNYRWQESPVPSNQT